MVYLVDHYLLVIRIKMKNLILIWFSFMDYSENHTGRGDVMIKLKDHLIIVTVGQLNGFHEH